jgi:hypothetical protein
VTVCGRERLNLATKLQVIRRGRREGDYAINLILLEE